VIDSFQQFFFAFLTKKLGFFNSVNLSTFIIFWKISPQFLNQKIEEERKRNIGHVHQHLSRAI
jgi:hypothetical protein